MKNAYPLKLLSATVVCVFLVACSSSIQTKLSGRVIDETTLMPVGDSIVISTWWGSKISYFVQSTTVCPHAMMVTTDEVGAFMYPKTKVRLDSYISGLSRQMHVYKAGYVYVGAGNNYKNESLYVSPFKGTSTERLKYIQHIINKVNCGEYSTQLNEFQDLYVRMYREALDVSGNDENNEVLTNIRYHMASPWWQSRRGYRHKDADKIFDKYIRPNL
jgi:hypothetical protein